MSVHGTGLSETLRLLTLRRFQHRHQTLRNYPQQRLVRWTGLSETLRLLTLRRFQYRHQTLRNYPQQRLVRWTGLSGTPLPDHRPRTPLQLQRLLRHRFQRHPHRRNKCSRKLRSALPLRIDEWRWSQALQRPGLSRTRPMIPGRVFLLQNRGLPQRNHAPLRTQTEADPHSVNRSGRLFHHRWT